MQELTSRLKTDSAAKLPKASFCAMSKGSKPTVADLQGELLLDFSSMKEVKLLMVTTPELLFF